MKKNHQKRKTVPPAQGSILLCFSSKKFNSDGNKLKDAPMQTVGVPASFASTMSLQDNYDMLNMNISAMVDKRESKIMENTTSSTHTTKGAAPPSITNQSENTEVLPSDVAKGSKKIPGVCLPITSESQLARYF